MLVGRLPVDHPEVGTPIVQPIVVQMNDDMAFRDIDQRVVKQQLAGTPGGGVNGVGQTLAGSASPLPGAPLAPRGVVDIDQSHEALRETYGDHW